MPEAEPLSPLAEQLRRVFSGEGRFSPEAQQWEHRMGSEGKINEETLLAHIAEIRAMLSGQEKAGQTIPGKLLSFVETRELVLAFEQLERLRLRRAVHDQAAGPDGMVTVPRADGVDVRLTRPEALGKVEGLDARIKWELYQEFWIDLLLEEVRDAEGYRAQFPRLQNVPRDVPLEGNIRAQLQTLQSLLQDAVILSRVRHLLDAEKKPEREVAPLLSQLSQPVSLKDMVAYNDRLTTNIQTILAQTVGLPFKGKGGERMVEVPLVFKLRTDLFQVHLKVLVQRENDLQGKMDEPAIKEKQALAEERKELLSQFLSYHATHVSAQRQLLHLFIEPGNVYAPDCVQGKPDLDYGPVPATERYIDAQRLRELESLAAFLDHLEHGELSDRMLDMTRLFEHLLMTIAVPREVGALEKEAKGALRLHRIHDTAWSLLPGGSWLQMEPAALRRIMEPVYRQFNLPLDFDTLSEDKKRACLQNVDVQREMESVRQIVREFRQKMLPEIHAMRGADRALLDLLRDGKDQTQRPMQDVLRERGRLPKQVFASAAPQMEPVSREGWPGNRTSQEIFQDILDAKSDAEVRGMYFQLIESATSGDGSFEAVYREYVERIGQNLGLHIDVADLQKYMGGAKMREIGRLLLLLGAEALAAYLSFRAVQKGLWKGASATARGTVKGARKLGDALGEESGIARKLRLAKKAPSSAAAAPESAAPSAPASRAEFEQGLEDLMKEVEAGKSATPESAAARTAGEVPSVAAKGEKSLSRLAKTARRTVEKYLGPAAIVLTAWELKDAVQLASSLEQLPETKAVEAALEFLETHPEVNRDIPEYRRDVANLRQRLHLLSVREVTRAMQSRIEGTSPKTKQGEELVQRAKGILDDAAVFRHFLSQQFPIDAYLHRSINDQEGVVRVDYAGLNGAREEGQRNMQRFFGSKPLPGAFAELNRRYEDFVKDATSHLRP